MTIPPAIHLRNGGTSVLLDTTTPGLPSVVHWGADLGYLPHDVLVDIARSVVPQRVSGGLDASARLTLLPQEAFGWLGTPGLSGSRRGRDFSTALALTGLDYTDTDIVLFAEDVAGRLRLRLDLAVTRAGLVTTHSTLTNDGDDGYEVGELAATLPLPDSAREILDTTGRHLRERNPQRHAFTFGSHVRESRKGRPGADATLLLVAGTPTFSFERGTAHALHLAWSGNHRLSAERSPSAPSFVRAAELLAPGEIILDRGESYTTPVAVASWGDGLNALSARFHEDLRSRPHHPRSPRKVTLNTWEAVYFDQDLDHLTRLADVAADVGVERFVLDDGWFRGRRDDTTSLGDWTVDRDVWRDGLSPLFDHLVARGLECGLWVEPEMVSPDSDLARAHPDWILGTRGTWPLEGRQQQVLDLSHSDAYDYVLTALDDLLTEYPIRYLKWDHNRDLLEAGSVRTGRGAVHANVEALYRLLDELKARHPGLEIESCASGGARVDLGILDHTDRIWASDTNDALERLTIQKYTGLVVPGELIGAHIGGPRAHTTGREQALSFRAAVALLGHFGIEWDLTAAGEGEIAEVSEWVALYKTWRSMLHSGASVHADLPDPSMDLRGVVAEDGESALFVFSQTSTSSSYPPDRVFLPGLDDHRLYEVSRLRQPPAGEDVGQSPLAWSEDPVTVTGSALRLVGLQPPTLLPEQAQVILLTEVAAS